MAEWSAMRFFPFSISSARRKGFFPPLVIAYHVHMSTQIAVRLPDDLLPPVGQRAAVIRQALREYYRRHPRREEAARGMSTKLKKLSRAG